MARPKKQIDKNQFESLCALQCTKDEICGFFELTDKTLDRWCKETYRKSFSDIFAEKRGVGKISLRRAQYETALRGNATMLVWLGKQWLKQREPGTGADEPEIEDNAFVSAELFPDETPHT